MRDTINVFLFPDLSPSASSEAALLARRWDAILGGGNLTSFAHTILLLSKQRVEPMAIWGRQRSSWRWEEGRGVL